MTGLHSQLPGQNMKNMSHVAEDLAHGKQTLIAAVNINTNENTNELKHYSVKHQACTNESNCTDQWEQTASGISEDWKRFAQDTMAAERRNIQKRIDWLNVDKGIFLEMYS